MSNSTSYMIRNLRRATAIVGSMGPFASLESAKAFVESTHGPQEWAQVRPDMIVADVGTMGTFSIRSFS